MAIRQSFNRYIFLVAFLPVSLFSFGEQTSDFLYRNITIEDGLRSNTVRNVVQDYRGFIWLGTDNGLCRYDGYSSFGSKKN
jgi:ligand-binding sensor domain-containing protein